MVVKFIYLNIVVLCSVFSEVVRQKADFESSANIAQYLRDQGLRFFITSDKGRYFLNENIPLYFKLKNIGTSEISVYLHKNYLLNFTITVRNTEGKNSLNKDIFRVSEMKQKNPSDPDGSVKKLDIPKKIILGPGEIFEKKLILQDLIELSQMGSGLERFDIQAFFYPAPDKINDLFIKADHEYSIFIDFSEIPDAKGKEKMSIMVPSEEESISIEPKEVVYLILNAEIESNWPNFLKYISIQDVIKDYPDYSNEYLLAKGDRKKEVLDKFRLHLTKQNINRLLNFKILPLTSVYKDPKDMARVRVEAMRKIDGYDRSFIYTYYLTRRSHLWKITKIETQLLK